MKGSKSSELKDAKRLVADVQLFHVVKHVGQFHVFHAVADHLRERTVASRVGALSSRITNFASMAHQNRAGYFACG